MTKSTRRDIVRAGLVLGGAVAGSGLFAPAVARAQGASPAAGVKALFFDVFGTVVDWRNSVARESEKILKPLGFNLNWLEFASAWRAEYQPGMDAIRVRGEAFVKLDIIHRRMLDVIRPRFGLQGLTEANMVELNDVWHRLDMWPDAKTGFPRLQKKFMLCPCSNGNIAIMAGIARHNGMQWDAILGSEIAQGYKPQPKVYLLSAAALNLKPEQCMMTAAHSNDLAAAAKQGLRTGHVGRPGEGGPGTGEDGPRTQVDVAGKNFNEFADKMGA